MNSQIKYIVQGILLALFFIFICNAIPFVVSLQLSESKPSVIRVVKPESSSENNLKGWELFSANCASCHAINKRLTGPALAGFEQRGPWKDRKKVYAWIHNPAGYMKNNAYTKELYKEYQVMMTSFPALSNTEIDAIIDVINRHENQPGLPIASVLYPKAKI